MAQVVLLVRFKTSLTLEKVKEIAESRYHEYVALKGLRQKYYLHDEATGEVGGLYVWESPEALSEFQESELRATIAETYHVVGKPRIEVYQVMHTLRESAP